jgi:AcrR family transcriptional regulator
MGEPNSAETTVLRADAARNRAKIIKAARKRLEAGDVELPMNTIARLAGVGVGTVYRHFPSRNALLEALALDGFKRLLASSESAAAEEDPATALRELLLGALLIEIDDIGLAKVLELPAEECMQTTAELREGIEAAAVQVIDRAASAGVIRADIGRGDLRRLVGGVSHAVRMTPAKTPEEAGRYLDILLNGLMSETA